MLAPWKKSYDEPRQCIKKWRHHLPTKVCIVQAFLAAQKIKRLPEMQETQVWSLGQEDLLEKEMATDSTSLAWRIQWKDELGSLQYTKSQKVRHNWSTYHFMVFPVVMYGCKRWTMKKTECQRIDAFELWCWRRLLRVPWTAEMKLVNPKENQPWVFFGRTDTEAETPVLRPPDVKSQLLGKRLWSWGRLRAEIEGFGRGWDG